MESQRKDAAQAVTYFVKPTKEQLSKLAEAVKRRVELEAKRKKNAPIP